MSGIQAKKIGRYEVLDILGQGGMGVVYLASDPVLGRKVAVKTILASSFATEDQEDLLRRLLKEGQAAANMRHAGIVTVFDAMQQGDETYIVMEYVAGSKLSDLLKERPDHETTLRILREIAEALDYAHEQGIVHRDIKPDNILLDSASKVRIADFGIAKSLTRHSISPGAVGTPHYMSPEQIRNEDEIDGKADQFSLGVIAYSMLTGRKPFDGKSQLAIGQKIVSEDPPRASKIEKSLPPEVDAVLMRALAKNPKHRYPTCTAMAEDLERAIDGSEPAKTSGTGDYARWLIAAAMVVIVAAGGFAAWKFWPKPQPIFRLAVYTKSTEPVTAGRHFSDPADLSATVTADRAIPSSARVELALLADGQLVDHAELRANTAGMKYNFPSLLPPGEYLLRLNVSGTQKKEVRFVIDAPPLPAPWAFEIRVMGKVVAEGDKFNKKDIEFGVIGPGDVTASVTSDRPVSSGMTGKLMWLKDGQPLGEVDLTADNIGKALPLVTTSKGPDPGQYTAKLSVDGQDKLLNFTIVGPQFRLPPPPPPPTALQRGLLGLEVTARNNRLASGQHFKSDDETYGQLGSRELTAQIIEKKPVPPGAVIELVWSVDGAETDHRTLAADIIGSRQPYRNIPEPGQYAVRVLVNRAVQSEFKFFIDK